jgi:hypothetical protein
MIRSPYSRLEAPVVTPHRSIRLTMVIAVGALVGLLAATPTLAATGWERVPTVHAGGSHGQDFLSDVAVDTSGKALAVGSYRDAGDYGHSLLTEWDGAAWHQLPSPNPGGIGPDSSNSLKAVSVARDGTAFAVGYWWSASNSGPLILRRHNGTWTRDFVGSPNTELFGVNAVSADEAWAVGSESYRAVTFHWNGTKWTKVPAPYPGGTVSLWNVVELSTHDVWADGYRENGDDPSTVFLVHWDGHAWSRVKHLHVQGFLNGIAARNAHDIWAVGNNGEAKGSAPVALHYDGQAWTATEPRRGGADAESAFNAVVAVGQNKLWAVGVKYTPHRQRALIEQWDGSAWTIVPTPDLGSPPPSYSGLVGVAAGGGDLWAVGFAGAYGLTLRRG